MEKSLFDIWTNQFAENIFRQKYSMDGQESWSDTCHRVTSSVCGRLLSAEDQEIIYQYIYSRKFLPGGRYLYAAGRPFHQVNNCFLFRAEDSREGWSEMMQKITAALMTGGGIGVDYSLLREKGARIKRTGGESTGPIALMNMVNEAGRHIMQGGQRRCLPGDSLVHTKRGLVPISEVIPGEDYALTSNGYRRILNKFVQGEQKTVKIKSQTGEFECTPNHKMAVLSSITGDYIWKEAQDLEEDDRLLFSSLVTDGVITKMPPSSYVKPAKAYTAKDITIPELDTDMAWFLGYFHGNGHCHLRDDVDKGSGKRHGRIWIAVPDDAHPVMSKLVEQLSRFGIFCSIKQGDGQCKVIKATSVALGLYFTTYIKRANEEIQVPDFILQAAPSIRASYVAGLMDADGSVSSRPICVMTSVYPKFTQQIQSICASLGFASRFFMTRPPKGKWQALYKLNITGSKQEKVFYDTVGQFLIYKIEQRRGRKHEQCSYSFAPQMVKSSSIDKKTLHKNWEVNYPVENIENIVGEQFFTPVRVQEILEGTAQPTFDIEVEDNHEFFCNGYLTHNSAIWAGLSWKHEDVKDFISLKDWSADIRKIKEKDFNFPAPMEGTNISVIYDTEFFVAIEDRKHPLHKLAKEIWQDNCLQAFKTAEPGMSFNFLKDNESLRNAPVSANTKVLTREGYVEVGEIVGREVEVYTGKQWAKTTFKKTREQDEVVKITFSNGQSLVCSLDHPLITEGWQRIEAQHLTPNHIVLGIDGNVNVVDADVLQQKEDVYCCDVGVEEHSFVIEGGIIVSNCTEVTSEDDSDKCNLGTVWMNRFDDREDFARCIKYATKFLLCGGIYSDVPTEKIREIGLKNNRIGLGLGGMHEWLMLRGEKYEVTPEMHKWLSVYEHESDAAAFITARELGVSKPRGVRAIAPTGCQKPDTLIVTEDGILELQELGNSSGEQWQQLDLGVAQENGMKIATRFFVNGEASTKRIRMKSGNILECTPNHQYRCLEGEGYVWKRADTLNIDDKLVVALNTYHKKNEPTLIDVPKTYRTQNSCHFLKEVNKDLAFFLGIFFADGSIHKKGIRIHTNAKKEDYKFVSELGQKLFGIKPTLENNGRNCLSVCFNSISLLKWLYVNNLDKPESKYMELPFIIRCFSRQSLEAFFDGYFFGDGSTSNSAKYIDTASYKMALQTQCVLRAIGIDCSIREGISGLGSPIFRITYVKTVRKDESHVDRKVLDNLGLKNCTVDRIVNIEDSQALTLDIEVPETTTYIANGVVSHNTIGILAETTTGIEPLFCKAYKRRYLKGETWHYEFVVDGAVKRLVDAGVKLEDIQDAYDISFKERVKFQADVQNYVDMSISSTCNLPSWGSELNNERTVDSDSRTLLKYAKRLRGFTCYPDGARGGQPLTRVELEEALSQEGVVFEEKERECVGGVCGV